MSIAVYLNKQTFLTNRKRNYKVRLRNWTCSTANWGSSTKTSITKPLIEVFYGVVELGTSDSNIKSALLTEFASSDI